MPSPRMPAVQYELIRLGGGLDQVTPTLALAPGVVRNAVNFECSITGGYTRIAGYERFDGRPSPSSATYSTIAAALSGAISPGQTIVGASSGASGVVIAIDGSTVAYTKAAGSFSVGESILVSGTPRGTVTATVAQTDIPAQQGAIWLNLAADVYRADIGAVPGSGPVRGVVFVAGVCYAWRDNAAGTALALYKSTSAGWAAVPLGLELRFTGGISEIAEGVTVTGQTSGATAVVRRTVKESGSWAGASAAGRLIFSSVTGTFAAGENLRVSGTTRAVASGPQSAISLLPGGRVEALVANFSGDMSRQRIYGCDGVNKAFEFDYLNGVYVPINTGMSADKPEHMAVHKQHLFLSFGSSVQHSSIGDPYVWSPVFGAGEIALPAAVTSFLVLPGDQSTGAMAVYTDDNTFILYGSSSANWQLATYNIGNGAKPYSTQNLTASFAFDDRGVMELQTSLNYSNFDTSVLTVNIRPFVAARRTLVTASSASRGKSQYRVFFSDGSAIYTTFANDKYVGSMPVQLPDPVRCLSDGQLADGTETSFFGSDNGFVYRLDVGTSFDGADIGASLTLAYANARTPRLLKRWRRASLEVSGEGFAQIDFSYSLAYGSTAVAQPVGQAYPASLAVSMWDSASWDSFVWDGRSLAPTEVEMSGSGENVAIQISSASDYIAPFTVNSVILHYSLRRGIR